MTTVVLADMSLSLLVAGLVWVSLAVMVFWIWESARVAMNWLLLFGVGLTATYVLLAGLGVSFEGMGWLSVLGAVLVTVGYYLSVKPLIDLRLREIQMKRRAVTTSAPVTPTA